MEIKAKFEDLQRKYREHLPKVDPALLDDLLLRQAENPGVEPVYIVEVFTREGLDPEKGREYIISRTGMSPAIYDNGTHYVTNQKLTLQALKEISDSDDVIEVTGNYTGHIGAYGASHEHKERDHERRAPAGNAAKEGVEKRKGGHFWSYVAIGIAGAIVLAALAASSGGMAPDANVPALLLSSGEPGALHGYVAGPEGVPAIGATVVAAEQSSGYTVNSFVTLTGQYYFDLPAGQYIIMVAFPDGTSKTVSGFEVERGSEHRLDISYY
jgi:hypothetical protein